MSEFPTLHIPWHQFTYLVAGLLVASAIGVLRRDDGRTFSGYARLAVVIAVWSVLIGVERATMRPVHFLAEVLSRPDR